MNHGKIKKIILKTGLFAIVATMILPIFSVFAQEDLSYTVLAPLPGTTIKENCVAGDPECKTDLKTYIEGAFKLAIGIAVVFAVLMIVIGGFQYMTTDAVQGKSAGKERLKNAVFGLVLVIGAWLILATINPNLLNINLNIDAVTTTSPPAGGTLGSISTAGVAMTPEQIAASNAVRATLLEADIETYRDPCVSGQTTGCVNLNGLSSTITNSLINFKESCSGCTVIITGGTESGHSTNSLHNVGTAIDLRKNSTISNYVTNQDKNPIQTEYGPRYTIAVDEQIMYFLDEGDHWHVSVTP